MLTSIRAVNKTDSATMGANFGTMAAMFKATETQLSAVPGLGPTKVKRLYAAFSTPFLRTHRSQTPSGGERVAASGHDASGAEAQTDSDFEGGERNGGGAGLTDEEHREWLATQEDLVDANMDDDADYDDDFA